MTNVFEIPKKKKGEPLIGKDISIQFPNLAENPFGTREGDTLIVAVCGAAQIRTNRCVPSYDPKTKTATILFHFTRPKWAKKALERLVIMRQLFAGSQLIQRDVIPATMGRDNVTLGVSQAV